MLSGFFNEKKPPSEEAGDGYIYSETALSTYGHSHPIDRLYRAGVSLSVNTDSCMLKPIALTREYEGMKPVFGWGREELLKVNRIGIDAAFAGKEVKERIKMKLEEGYASIEQQ